MEEVAEEVAEYEELPTNELGTSYGAPEGEEEGSGDAADYGDQAADYGDQAAEYDEQPSYAEEEQATYEGDQDAAASEDSAADDAAADPLAMLMKSVPGIPGEDYPIYAEVPETGFSCDGQVDGGYYSDPEAECQVFHICTTDGSGGLTKYSFLCPNGTLFSQEYFICDWWFNFDCAEAESLYGLNDEIAAERAAAADSGLDSYGSGIEAQASYDQPIYSASASDDINLLFGDYI